MNKTNRLLRIQITPGMALLLIAALVQGVQYIYAFVMVHNADLKTLAIIGGVMTGLVVVGSVAYAGGRLPVIRSKRAFWAASVAFLILLVVSPFILTPINWYSMNAGLRLSIGGYAWVLAGLVASVPEIAIALVAFADRGLMPGVSTATAKSGNTTTSTRASKKKQTAGALLEECSELSKHYMCTMPGCSWSPSVDALAAAAQAGKSPKSAAVAAKAGHVKSKHPKPVEID